MDGLSNNPGPGDVLLCKGCDGEEWVWWKPDWSLPLNKPGDLLAMYSPLIGQPAQASDGQIASDK